MTGLPAPDAAKTVPMSMAWQHGAWSACMVGIIKMLVSQEVRSTEALLRGVVGQGKGKGCG